MSKVYKAPSPTYIQAKHFGPHQDPIKWIVMHSTVSACREGAAVAVAHFFATETGETSAHYVVDPATEVQCVPDHNEAWHCGYNKGSIGIEMCDMPDEKSKERWNDKNHQLMLDRAAKLAAQLCLAYNIRPYFVGGLGLRLGRTGITTHALMSKTFKRSTHWDPGAWPRFQFMKQVRRHYRELR